MKVSVMDIAAAAGRDLRIGGRDPGRTELATIAPTVRGAAVRAVGVALCWLMLSGCRETAFRAETPSRDDPEARAAQAEALARKDLERADIEPAPPSRGEVPDDVMARVRAHLAGRTGASEDRFEVVRAQAVEWPSGAMGCPQPGVFYTQSLVPGYWIVLRHDGRDYDYRLARSGHFVLCEGRILDDPPAQ